PKLSRNQELVYRGTYSEETLGSGVQCRHQYRIESRVFVLETSAHGAEVALLTVLKPRESSDGPHESAPRMTRLELAKIDSQGRLLAERGESLAVPLDGPPTFECGQFVEVPHRRIGIGQSWEVGEDGRPLRSWQVAGSERVGGNACLKVV